MNITYKLTQDEYLQAVHLHYKRGKRRILTLAIYALVALLIVIVGTDFSNTREIITNMIAAFFSISFYILFVRILSTYQAKSVYQKSTTLHSKVTLHISGKGIKLDKNHNNASIPWNAFSKWKKDERFYLLYTNPRQFNVIPIRAMSEMQENEFDTYLKKYISQS
jgi:hypothetical protein